MNEKNKKLDELRESENVVERLAYANAIRTAIEESKNRMTQMESDLANGVRVTDLMQEVLSKYGDSELRENLDVVKRIEEDDKSWWQRQIEAEKKHLARLKDMLAGYDIYRQKKDESCLTCKESICICEEVLKNENNVKKEDLVVDIPF